MLIIYKNIRPFIVHHKQNEASDKWALIQKLLDSIPVLAETWYFLNGLTYEAV